MIMEVVVEMIMEVEMIVEVEEVMLEEVAQPALAAQAVRTLKRLREEKAQAEGQLLVGARAAGVARLPGGEAEAAGDRPGYAQGAAAVAAPSNRW